MEPELYCPCCGKPELNLTPVMADAGDEPEFRFFCCNCEESGNIILDNGPIA